MVSEAYVEATTFWAKRAEEDVMHSLTEGNDAIRWRRAYTLCAKISVDR